MARLRTIKPGFFLDEDLAECQPLARLLFAGLWCIADREGRLEDRPKRIKVEVLPYDDCDCDALLGELEARGFVIRYEAEGRRYIAAPSFVRHQNPHVKEAASTIPPPPEAAAKTERAPDKHGASTGQAPDEPGGVLSLGSCLLSSELDPLANARAFAGAKEGEPDDDFATWWATYARGISRVAGSKAAAHDLYRWWREHGADADELLRAAAAYRLHCERNSERVAHGKNFLARHTNRWREWAEGEEHGAMTEGNPHD